MREVGHGMIRKQKASKIFKISTVFKKIYVAFSFRQYDSSIDMSIFFKLETPPFSVDVLTSIDLIHWLPFRYVDW